MFNELELVPNCLSGYWFVVCYSRSDVRLRFKFANIKTVFSNSQSELSVILHAVKHYGKKI